MGLRIVTALLVLAAPAFAGGADPLHLRRAPGALCLRVKERLRRLERRVSSDDPTRKRLRLWQAEYLDLPPLDGHRRRQRSYHLARALDHAAPERSFRVDSALPEPCGLEDDRIDVSEAPPHSASFDALPEKQRRARAFDGLIAALLPGRAVAGKASWSIAAVEALALFVPEGRRFRGQAVARLRGFKRGARGRRVRITLRIRGVVKGSERFESCAARCKLDGELLWDEAGYPASLKLEGEIERRIQGQYVNIDSAGKLYRGLRYTRRRCEVVALSYSAEAVGAAEAAAALDESLGRSPPRGPAPRREPREAPRPRRPRGAPKPEGGAVSPPSRPAPGRGEAASAPRCSS